MTRLQKKCFLMSLAMHGLLAIVLIASAAFRSNPEPSDVQVMTMVPSLLLDRRGSGGGASPALSTSRPEPVQHMAPEPPRSQPVSPTRRSPQPQAEVAKVPARPAPEEVEVSSDRGEASDRPVKKHHEIKPDFTLADSNSLSAKETRKSRAAASEVSRAEESRRLHDIESTLQGLATNVRSRGGQVIAVDLAGAGGGEAFASYETAIFNAYFHAWTAPEEIADRLADVDTKIVVARDGTILSAEIVRRSEHREMDRSVEQALRRVTKLPPFPESAHDSERTFIIHFNLDLESKRSPG